jgi:hypothetical protein
MIERGLASSPPLASMFFQAIAAALLLPMCG